MDKTIELQSLFSEWKTQHFLNDSFYEDGIIDEKQFEANPQGKRILFIAKEPNGRNHEDRINHSFVEEWNKEKAPDYIFAWRMAEWTYGIINEFPPYKDAAKHPEYLRRIAFMNLKKKRGIGLSDKNEIDEFVVKHQDFISRQIQIIEADIIILCTSFSPLVRSIFFKGAEWRDSGYEVGVARWNRAVVIDFYHPSSRNVPAASYSLLQNVISSKTFKDL